jgi:hypothetical protein
VAFSMMHSGQSLAPAAGGLRKTAKKFMQHEKGGQKAAWS